MMIMLPRLQAQERIARIADLSFPHASKRDRERMANDLRRQASGPETRKEAPTQKLTPEMLAGMGMAVRYRKRPESPSTEHEASGTPAEPESPSDDAAGGHSR